MNERRITTELRADIVSFLRTVAYMIPPRDDGIQRDDVLEKRAMATALLKRIEGN